ncbi:MAG TPA: orotidine-5'-phosphate decarboxylase [Methanocorpusculum sp.]|nr:orotidine-5'-phosphate decarboxylase [Methanocorpusculum sp.]HJJ40074.1 orotidine-5'-phosphate decarboxylase [Methanocorpusculum sp.]HJJ49557.1 orotidine-5'-phosphate decarboxylase [Methanocorpusculum sp.]HJJ57109.1 orotidine-5'-phosphate decarboxylase [Methanocorpusculum sp.]
MAQLLLALDVKGREKALEVAKACSGEIDAIKIGYPLILSTGLGIVKELAEFGTPIIADFKVADIPNTNVLICEEVFKAGCSGIICHAFCGEDSLKAVVDVAHAHNGEAYVVCEMSHPGALAFLTGENAEKMAEMAKVAGADGIIAPATRPERTAKLRTIIGTNMKICSPGVGAQGAQPEDVKKYVDGIIVGRAIYDAANPKKAAHDFKVRCQ